MPPGGETFRFSPRFGENVLHHGSHEWLPYSKDEVHLKSSNNNLRGSLLKPINTFLNNVPHFRPGGYAPEWGPLPRW